MESNRVYTPKIGLEIHVALSTQTKAFCGCAVTFADEPNTHCCSVCLGLPGGLPVLNEAVVESAMKLGIAVGGQIQTTSMFDRKHYFYPDLPKGFQITQQMQPIIKGGYITLPDGCKIALRQIHIEEDAGKLTHIKTETLCDYNRAGVPLLEIVTEPCITSGEQAADCVRTLRTLVQHLGISNGQMQEGSLRCDVNISMHTQGEDNPRVEVKNLNSFRSIVATVDYEVQRQTQLLNNKETILQETRGFVDDTKTTVSMRDKEDAQDYCYMPEPDLPPLVLQQNFIGKVKQQMPMLPMQLQRQYEQQGISRDDALTLTTHKPVSDLFYETLLLCKQSEIKPTANLFLSEILRLYQAKQPIEKLTAAQMYQIIGWIETGEISFATAKKTIAALVEKEHADAKAYIDGQDLWQIQDEKSIVKAVNKVLAENEKVLQDYLSGKQRAKEALVGSVMRHFQGKADAAVVRQCVQKALDEKTQP